MAWFGVLRPALRALIFLWCTFFAITANAQHGSATRHMDDPALRAQAQKAAQAAEQASEHDPYEPFNRAMFSLHQTVDNYALKPVARLYNYAVPLPAQHSFGNFFGNTADIWIGTNNLLQGKVQDAGVDALRLLVNSTLGILGLFDVASELGLEKHEEDFGQTLAVWGVPEGNYLFLPFIGPRTLRDGVAWFVDIDPMWWFLNPPRTRNIVAGVRALDIRANLLPLDRVLEESGTDHYLYLREAYLQMRRYQVSDGERPANAEDEDYSKE